MAKEKQIVRRARKGRPIRQVAAIPCRLDEDGRLRVLLVTTRGTRRFLVPKGWPMKGKSGRKAAEIEAREEAGVEGSALPGPIGTYSYWKRLSDSFVPVKVTVYLMRVQAVREKWKEAAARERAWLSPDDAATLIDEPQLAALVRALTPAALPA